MWVASGLTFPTGPASLPGVAVHLRGGPVIPSLRDNSPGGLAAQLANARTKREAAVAAANQKYNAQRDSVIERGVTRIKQIDALQAELTVERGDLESVVGQAK